MAKSFPKERERQAREEVSKKIGKKGSVLDKE